MAKNFRPHVTVAISNFNGADTLLPTIASIKQLNYGNYSILLCDDGSSDESVSLVEEEHPDIQILRNEKTQGVSRVRNALLTHSVGRMVFLVDNDVILDSDCLLELVRCKAQQPNAVVVTPRVLSPDGRLILSDGARLHYLAAAVHYHRYQRLIDVANHEPVRTECGSGGIMLLDKLLAEQIGFFDSDFRFGWTDGEFFIRATYAGLYCFVAPKAFLLHRQKNWGTKRSGLQLRNRWYIILINYSLRTIVAIAPALFLYETLLFLMMVAKRDLSSYITAWKEVFKNRHLLKRKRQLQQRRKVLRDCSFLSAGEITIDPGLIKNPFWLTLKKTGNVIFDAYWKILIGLRAIN